MANRRHFKIKKKRQVFGGFIEVKITEQYNSHDVIFKKKARLNDPEEVRRLLKDAEHKGLELPKFLS